jgi:hypothetical protein
MSSTAPRGGLPRRRRPRAMGCAGAATPKVACRHRNLEGGVPGCGARHRLESRRTLPLPAEAWRDPRRCQASVAGPRAPEIRRARKGAWHLLVRAGPSLFAMSLDRGRGNAWRRNPEGCVLAPQPLRLRTGAATSIAACPAAVPGIASNRGGRCRCRSKHGAIRGDARPPSLAHALPKSGAVARSRRPHSPVIPRAVAESTPEEASRPAWILRLRAG